MVKFLQLYLLQIMAISTICRVTAVSKLTLIGAVNNVL